MIKEKIISAFENEFSSIKEKFEIMDLLASKRKMDSDTIENIMLPSEENNIVWHPGVYFFLGNDSFYKVGVSLQNSRARVMQHLDACTARDGYGIWDINDYDDKSILLINVKDKRDRHWLLAIEAYFEEHMKPLIRAGRIG
jgi:hypothetical protein